MARLENDQAHAQRPSMTSPHAVFSRLLLTIQGYNLLDEEIDMSLDDFRDKYADTNGLPE